MSEKHLTCSQVNVTSFDGTYVLQSSFISSIVHVVNGNETGIADVITLSFDDSKRRKYANEVNADFLAQIYQKCQNIGADNARWRCDSSRCKHRKVVIVACMSCLCTNEVRRPKIGA